MAFDEILSGRTHRKQTRTGGAIPYVIPTDADGVPVGGGGGSAADAAYTDDTGAADGSTVSLLKGIYVQNVAIIALLTQIETNTGTP